MTFTEQEIESIVVEVIRKLGLLGSQRRPAGQAADAASPGSRELILAERVVTLRLIEGRLMGVIRVVVPATAVITPAVKDELKQRSITLVRQASS